MVKADESKIKAIINTVKSLPVDCKNFDIADSWVGIVIELENILNGVDFENVGDTTEVPVLAPDNNEVVDNG